MNEEIKADRSPRSPSTPLSDAIDQIRKLHSEIGRARVKPESAAIALNYKGLNGAALTTLATLSQYGLIERSRGEVSITALAVKILHPTGEEQQRAAVREAALNPTIFKEIQEQFSQCSVEVLTSHLVQQGFTPDRARRTASVFAVNKGFANLSDAPKVTSEDSLKQRTDESRNQDSDTQRQRVGKERPANMLAQYSIPLGRNEATLTFAGESLSIEDFDALIEYVELFKKQFSRKASIQPTKEHKPEGAHDTSGIRVRRRTN